MLRTLLKQMLGGKREAQDARREHEAVPMPSPPAIGAIPEPGTLEHSLWLLGPHKEAPLGTHLHTLFDGIRAGNRDFLSIVEQALGETSSSVPTVKVVRRHLAAWYLARYFSRARGIPGAWAECGVYSGASALTLCLAARAEDPAFDGSGLHLVDSFEGLSEPVADDAVREPVRDPGLQARAPRLAAGTLSAPVEVATRALREFPGVRILKGWIPPVFAGLPDFRWSFVHLDVDLYEPTLESLRYFEPRLSSGGTIICDDYGALTFPGAARAWDRYFTQRKLPFVVLPTGQAVFVSG